MMQRKRIFSEVVMKTDWPAYVGRYHQIKAQARSADVGLERPESKPKKKSMATMEVMTVGDEISLNRPCVDCVGEE